MIVSAGFKTSSATFRVAHGYAKKKRVEAFTRTHCCNRVIQPKNTTHQLHIPPPQTPPLPWLASFFSPFWQKLPAKGMTWTWKAKQGYSGRKRGLERAQAGKQLIAPTVNSISIFELHDRHAKLGRIGKQDIILQQRSCCCLRGNYDKIRRLGLIWGTICLFMAFSPTKYDPKQCDQSSSSNSGRFYKI